ncbi:MAG: hypothetical protein QG590_1360, partial [Pseudomonadota bacterium]|nr:hypothetical protein [Pseudomonadota bacterium]
FESFFEELVGAIRPLPVANVFPCVRAYSA